MATELWHGHGLACGPLRARPPGGVAVVWPGGSGHMFLWCYGWVSLRLCSSHGTVVGRPGGSGGMAMVVQGGIGDMSSWSCGHGVAWWHRGQVLVVSGHGINGCH